jgi:hypothetical protein
LISIITREGVASNLLENVAVCIGRLALGMNDRSYNVTSIKSPFSFNERDTLQSNLFERTFFFVWNDTVCPDKVAPYFSQFMHNWLIELPRIRSAVEKESAFRGLIRILERRAHEVSNPMVRSYLAISSLESVLYLNVTRLC